jgi:glycosyltransferase involved in cell wall biosynthesis
VSPTSLCFVLPSAYGYFDDEVDAVGGAERQLSLISRWLVDRFDVHFVVGDYGQPRTTEHDGVTIHRSYEPGRRTPVRRKPRQLVRLLDAMRRADADVYVFRGRPYLAAVTYVLVTALRSQWVYNVANDIYITEQPDDLPAAHRLLFEYALANAAGVITQSDRQATLLREKYDRQSEVVPSGYPEAEGLVDHDRRSSFLWVGRIDEEQKRPDLFLDVAVRAPGESFDLVGPAGDQDPYTERVLERAAALDNVTYHGYVPPGRVHDHYAHAIALVNTSAYEGFPSTFLEAWRYDTPVLSLTVPPSRFATDDADAGYADDDLDRLAALVRELGADPAKRATVSEPTYQYFLDNLTIDVVADRYGDVIERLAEGEGPHSR